ncbi:hypothetical protein ASD86_19265 [Lysobacter sp. Root690]|nr:hypothetical protein ASD86_19265 [Lysobacter sp. Root690]
MVVIRVRDLAIMAIFGFAISESRFFGLAFAGERFRLAQYSAALTVFTDGDRAPAGCPAWFGALHLATAVSVDPIAGHRNTNLPWRRASRIQPIRTALFGLSKLAQSQEDKEGNYSSHH